MPEEQNRSGMLAQVRNPLIFFALALLIIEGIIGLVVTNSQITAAHQFYSVCIMASLFLVVVLVVAAITIWWPSNLYEDVVNLKEFINSEGFRDAIEDVLVEKDRVNLKELTNSDGFRHAIEEVLVERIKPECLAERQR